MRAAAYHRALLLVALCSPFVACTTLVDNPGAYRQQKGTTIGMPGAMVHPNASTGLGLTLITPEKKKLAVNSGGTGNNAYSINPLGDDPNRRDVSQEAWGVSSFAMLFPSPKSFFFFGLGANYKQTRSAYDERVTGFSLADKKTNVEWTDHSYEVTAPLGISLNTKEGVTSVAAVGPRVRVANSRSFHFDGRASDVDVAARDATLKSYDEVADQVGFHFMYLVGYSF